MNLESYIEGRWIAGRGNGKTLRDAATGVVIAHASTDGMDFRAVLEYARNVGGPALRQLTFQDRATLLKKLAKFLSERKEEFHALSFATGATRNDALIDIDGGITTAFVFASKGSRELPDGHVFVDGAVEGLSKRGTFLGQHICVPLEGAAVHINAFNFPVWGLLEKLAASLLAGVPAIVKPATATSYLTALVFRRMIESKLFPEGALQLVCGSVGDLFEHLNCQDVVAFTGSASTARALRRHAVVAGNAVRFTAETDSLNSCILGPDAKPGTAEFELFVREVVREMTAKAGQKCTAIRKALVPIAHADEAAEAIQAQLAKVLVGDPRLANVTMGPLASLEQRREVLGQVSKLCAESDLVSGNQEQIALQGANSERGAFIAPTLLRSRDAGTASAVHSIEAFGPVCTLMSYQSVSNAICLVRRGGGSLVTSLVSADAGIAREIVLGIAPYHGRVLVLDNSCAEESTGHGSPLPHLIHGGPGRAGGGEEMGGIRGVLHYMQRTAIQGSPDTLAAITGRFVRGSTQREPGRHPFRKSFHQLAIGDTFNSIAREITVADIGRFADLSGDRFYAHMSDTEAARNPLFGSRVAHGYFLISAAAGLFVDPAYGPVLGNYGLDNLRFVQPVKPGDRIKVRLTCKSKSLRADQGWGEVVWDTEIINHNGETVAAYDVLTMVSERESPDAPALRKTAVGGT